MRVRRYYQPEKGCEELLCKVGLFVFDVPFYVDVLFCSECLCWVQLGNKGVRMGRPASSTFFLLFGVGNLFFVLLAEMGNIILCFFFCFRGGERLHVDG